MCSQQSNVTAFNKQQRKKSRTEVTWYKWADETEYPVSMAAKSGTWVPGRCFCLPAGRQRALFWVRTNRRIIIYARSCGLSATKSVYFAFFNTCAWLSHFEQGKEKKTLWILIFFFYAAFVNSDCEVGDEDIQKPMGNFSAFRTLCLFSYDELLKHFVKTWFRFCNRGCAIHVPCCWCIPEFLYIQKYIVVCYFSYLETVSYSDCCFLFTNSFQRESILLKMKLFFSPRLSKLFLPLLL